MDQTKKCPSCEADNREDALFCETCGYDFTTGSLPRDAAAALDLDTPLVPPAAPAPVSDPVAAPTQDELVSDVDDDSQPDLSQAPEPDPQPELVPAEPPVLDAPSGNVEAPAAESSTVEWVAEVWVDPEWYADQQATDAMPPAGLPDVVGLRRREALIGRASRSRGIDPEVDCHEDNSCSRRQAQLTFDGTHWYVEDLDSANGTFVGLAGMGLPEHPIPRGRIALGEGDRIYVGAWTRIVVRRATPDERAALA